MEEGKKGRGLGKGLSELLGEARVKAAMAKQVKNDISQEQENDKQEIAQNLSEELQKAENITEEFNAETLSDLQALDLHSDQSEIQSLDLNEDDEDDFDSLDAETDNLPLNHNIPDDITRFENEDDFEDDFEDDDEFETVSIQSNTHVPASPQVTDAASVLEKEEKEEKEEEEKENENEQNQDIQSKPEQPPEQIKEKHSYAEEFIQTIGDTGITDPKVTKIIDEITEDLRELDRQHSDDYDRYSEEETPKKLHIPPKSIGIQHIVHQLPIEFVAPNEEQPRKFFDTEGLKDLAESIATYGIIQPILVNQVGQEYQIVAGERRWRASQIAGMKTIPSIIVDYPENKTLEVALIENIQRIDLTPLDEAQAYHELIDKYELTQAELGKKVSKSRSYIANMLRLLELNPNIKKYLKQEQISVGHARLLVGNPNADYWADRIYKQKLSVRQTEDLLRKEANNSNSTLPMAHPSASKNSDIMALEADLKAALGISVSIQTKSTHKGNLVIRYESLEQLDEICKRLCSNWGNDV